MAKVKIISNPYQKEICYQRWEEETDDWISIDYANNPNSKLLSKELSSGFFPFKAKQIIELIAEEYGVSGEDITVLFEGSSDEFAELKSVCESTEFDVHVIPEKSSVYLENARDILPEVKKLFQEMSPLIMQSVSQEKIQRDLGRFADASSDVVPICVLGNYSAGKSTFINALIGNEILPSGIEPITAKVYKISRSKYFDRAQIYCQFLGRDMHLSFTEKETHIEAGIEGNPLYSLLVNALDQMDGESIVLRMNKALSIINQYENDTENTMISDLIEVEIPFQNGILAKSQHPFVIFDTPGSNSASNAKHLQVLKEAMANMTNGLPVFLSTPDSLDSTDNENLYHIIRDLDELDNRFTMIVVNKADSAGIQRRGATEQDQKRILSQAVPRNLYSGGLFYVSSILGLGAKTNGAFIDYIYEDIYDAQVTRYSDPGNKHYRNLYLFNIMPLQIKTRSDAVAAEQANLVYANSGLFSIETEIESFAGKYAAYNKCFQSQLFLRKVIAITEDDIEEQKQSCEEIRQSIRDKLEEDKKHLIEKLEAAAAKERDHYDSGYADAMSGYVETAEGTFTAGALREQEQIFTEAQEGEQDYNDRRQDVRSAMGSVSENLKANAGQIFKNRKLDLVAVKAMAQGFASDVGNVWDKSKVQRDTRRDVDLAAAEELLKYVAQEYERKLTEIHALLDEKSREYWTHNTELIRELLARIVSGSEVLTNDRRQELERIIITYQQITFDSSATNEIFDKVHFERKVKIGDFVIWQSDHLNIEKLARTYNTNLKQTVNERYASIENSHRESAHNWIQSLLDEIYTNIVEYSPELSKQAKQIQSMTKQIEGLIERKNRLKEYTKQLCTMMDWKMA